MRATLIAALALIVLAAVWAAKGWRGGGLPGSRPAKDLTVLFLGTDGGRLDGNTDTIVLARVEPSRRRVAALWIPRDTRVTIPGRGPGKINAANPAGGPELAVRAVEQLLDVKIDYYVLMDFKAAARVIDQLGGVEVDVPADMDYDDPTQDLHIHLRRGRQRLNGEQALAFARFRKLALGDIDRTRNQQALVAALLDRLLSPAGLVRLPGAIRTAFDSSRTNASLADLAALTRAVRGGGWALVSETLPGAFLDLHGISYWSVDPGRARAAWADLLAGQTRPPLEERAAPSGRKSAGATSPGAGRGTGAAPEGDGAAAAGPAGGAPAGSAGAEDGAPGSTEPDGAGTDGAGAGGVDAGAEPRP